MNAISWVALWLATMAGGQTQDGNFTADSMTISAPASKPGYLEIFNTSPDGTLRAEDETGATIDLPLECDPNKAESAYWTNCHIKKPTEHVIEIRTKRVPNGWTRVCWFMTYVDSRPCEEIKTPKYCPTGATCEDLQDTHKTLWIDGQKIGVIKEVEEK